MKTDFGNTKQKEKKHFIKKKNTHTSEMDESDAPQNRSNDEADLSKSSDENVSKNRLIFLANVCIRVNMAKKSINRISEERNKNINSCSVGRGPFHFYALRLCVLP